MKAKMDLSQKFQNAQQAQKGHLGDRVKELEAQIEAIRAQGEQEKDKLQQALDELALKLAENGGVRALPTHLIDPNPNQPRKTFPKKELTAFGVRLSEQGQQTPVILIPHGDRFILFDGERRWRTAQLLEWTTIDAVFLERDLPDKDTLRKQALATTRDRADLHPLDLAECIVEEILYQHPQLAEDVTTIPNYLNSGLRRLERDSLYSNLATLVDQPSDIQGQWLETAPLSLEQQWVIGVILQLRYHPANIHKNVFPLLDLPEDAKQLIRETGIDGSKALKLKKLSSKSLGISEIEAEQLRAEFVHAVDSNNLSLKEVDNLLQKTMTQYKPVQTSTYVPETRYVRTIKNIPVMTNNLGELEELRKALKDKLQEIDRALSKFNQSS